MKHDYLSHSMPAPIVKDAGLALSSALGDLSTTHSLMEVMQVQIERLQDAARKHGEYAEGIMQPYIMPGLSRLWSLAEALEQRVKDSIILLQAIEEYEPQGGEPTTSISGRPSSH